MTVSELMTYTATTVAPDAMMSEAVKRMAEHDIGCLPVTDADGCVVGIVTDRDICLVASSRDLPMSQLPISIAMTEEVVAVTPSTALEEAERLLRERQLHRLPVIDEEGRAIGMISLNDLARAASGDGHQIGEIGETVAAIAEPPGTSRQSASP